MAVGASDPDPVVYGFYPADGLDDLSGPDFAYFIRTRNAVMKAHLPGDIVDAVGIMKFIPQLLGNLPGNSGAVGPQLPRNCNEFHSHSPPNSVVNCEPNFSVETICLAGNPGKLF